MNFDPVRHTSPPVRLVRLSVAVLTACVVLASASGCDELDARRKIQEAGKLYQKGRFSESAELYEQVLARFQTGDVAEVAHYNAGITYSKMFRPGVDTPDNLKIAEATARHFAAYLDNHPDDRVIVGMMTQVWMDSGQYQSALAYWEREHAKNPRDAEVIGILAGIHRQAGNWEKAVEWHYKEAEVLDSPAAKANSYANVGKIASNKLFNRNDVVWFDRLKVADVGIAALQKAEELTPSDPDIQTYLGIIYSLRAEAHQAAWAQLIDKSHGRYHHSRSAALKRAQEGHSPNAPGDQPEEDKASPPAGEGSTEKGAGEEGKPANGAGGQGAVEGKPADATTTTPEAKPTEATTKVSERKPAEATGTKPDGANP